MRPRDFQPFWRRLRALSFVSAALLWTLCPATPVVAQQKTSASGEQLGSATGLVLPRYASLKTDRVNLREGPSKEHATTWVFQRAGLPVEITAEFETWRKVRDSEGSEGWVLHSLLSGRRTALVAPGKKDENFKIFARASAGADLAATLQSGVIGNVRNCDGAWCLIDGDGFKGYIQQSNLWGVYPGEKIE
jgi:SH3-like domain-containing protein